MLESLIQKKIIKKLRDNGWLVRKIISCGDAGWPDIEAFKAPARVVHIEVKQPGKKPTVLQEHRIAQLRSQGFEVIVADKLEDVQHLYTAYDVSKTNFFNAIDNL